MFVLFLVNTVTYIVYYVSVLAQYTGYLIIAQSLIRVIAKKRSIVFLYMEVGYKLVKIYTVQFPFHHS